jgi:hypothetical protein
MVNTQALAAKKITSQYGPLPPKYIPYDRRHYPRGRIFACSNRTLRFFCSLQLHPGLAVSIPLLFLLPYFFFSSAPPHRLLGLPLVPGIAGGASSPVQAVAMMSHLNNVPVCPQR